jgi:hypothetical protein
MNCNIEKLKQDIESLERKCKNNTASNDVRGTRLLVKTNFDPNTTLSVESIKIASDLVKIGRILAIIGIVRDALAIIVAVLGAIIYFVCVIAIAILPFILGY